MCFKFTAQNLDIEILNINTCFVYIIVLCFWTHFDVWRLNLFLSFLSTTMDR